MEKAISIPSITVDPKVMFYEDEQPDEFKAYNEQRVVVKNTWKDILNNENDIFQGAEFPVPGNNGQTIILSPSVREGIDWQLSFIDKDGVPAMHEDYYRNDSDNPNRSKLNNEDALISRLTDYSLYNREITVRVLYEGEQIMAEKNIQNVAEEEKIIVEFQSASISNYEGYVALAQYDRENLNSDAEHNVFLGKSENYNHNYEGRGKYDNTDNSLVFISNNKKMFSFLYSSGWVFGQQKLIDKGVFTEEDYAEFANLKETVLKQFNETREIKFEIDVSKKNSGVSFSYPDWEGKESERKRRLFVDMDGTLARFHDEVQYLERMWEKDFFANLRPFENVVEGVREFIKENPDVEVFALSSVIDSEYCVDEKNQWLDKYLPEIPLKNRMFPKAGSSKSEFVKEVTGIEVTVDDFLLDDYTVNLVDWQPPGRGIKLLNAINHTKGSWQNDKIRFDRDPSDFAKGLATVMVDNEHIYDERVEQPVEIPTKWENDEPLVDIYNLEYDGEGYLHFAVDAEGYVLEGLFRLHDPANGNDMELVSIDYGDRHPIIEKQWDRIEHALVEASMERYKEMIFPCKVGQVVYGFEYPRTDITVVAEETVESLEVTEDGFFIETNGADYVLEDFGKRVFLSREEAQAVLDAREANDTHREDITLKDDVITYVAIESTEDYTDPTFHQSLIDDDIQNPDGSYGKVVNKYRLVVIGSEGRIIPLDNRVFDSFNEVSVALLTTSNYRMVNYDDMVKEAENIHIAVTHYSLDEISSELNKRDDIWIIPEDAVGIASYSFDVLSRAERILINRDPEMVQRYALVDKLNEDAEKTYGFAALSDEAVSQSYKFARDKSIPFAELESRVKDVFLYDGMSEEEIAEAKAAEKDYSAIVKYDDVLKVNDAVLLCNMFVDTDENNEGNYLYGNLRFDGQYYGILYRIENEKEGEPMKLVEIAEIPELNEPPVGQETTLKIEEMLTSYLAGEYKEPIYKSLKEAMEAGANLAEKQFVADLAKYDYIHTLYGDTCLGYAYDTNNYPNRAESPVKEIYDNVNDEVQVEVIQDAKTENPYRLVILTAGRFGERDSEHDIIYNQPMSDELLKLYNRENKTPFLETVYAMCGNAGEQPFNYYGHTLSTDDTVVVMTPDGADCHYVARFGFEAEPDVDKAISPEQRKMARLGMTVKEEFELLDRMYSFGDKKTNDQIIDRLNVLTMEYLYPINLAPVREILRNEQDKLRVINNWERQSDIFDKITFEYNEGKFTVEGGAIRECMPQQNFSNGYEYGVSKIIAGENLQNEIDRRYEAAEKRKLLEEVRVDLEFRNIAMSDENIEENINEYFAHHRSRNADDIADFIENSIAEEKSYELFARESAAINALADRLTDFIFESEYAEIPNYFSEIIDVESRASAKADIINLIESGYTEELYNALDNVMEEWSDTLREDVSLEGGNILTALESYDNMIAAYKAENEMKEKESELEGRSVEVNGWFDNFAQNFVRNEMNQENQDNRNTLNQEAYAALAKRIEEFSYDNDYFNYSDVVGIEPENREAQTADIEGYLVNRTEDLQYIADFIRENRDEYQRADEGIGNYSVEIREANDLLYSLEHLDQYLDFYHRNAPANARIPVNEFYNLDGRILEGERIPLEKSGVPHFADRSIVYNAVMKFEEDNNIPVNQREIAPDGTYTDKEFLYMAYDRYVGMSHQNDLSIQAYKPHMDAILADHSVEANNLLLIAEIYYAQRNGLSYEQIDYALTAAKEAFPVATMRNIRHGFEQGLSVEQLDVILGEDSLAQEHLIEFMIDGGSIENAKALKGADVAAYYTLKDHLNNGTISPENARAIVKTINFLKEANRADYASKYIEMEAGKAKPRFSMVDFDYMTEALVSAIAENPTVNAEQIDAIGLEFWKQNEADNIREFLENFLFDVEVAHNYDKIGELSDLAIKLEDFASKAIEKQNRPWGYWGGRISNPDKPQDYINIDITGYDRDGGFVIEAAQVVLDGKVKEVFAFDEQNWKDFVNTDIDTNAEIDPDSALFIDRVDEIVSWLDLNLESDYVLYNNHGIGEHTLDEHYNLLKEKGYDIMPSYDEYNADKQQNDVIHFEDISDVKCVAHKYSEATRETIYTFECNTKGEKDRVELIIRSHDDGVSYVIASESLDGNIVSLMNANDSEKLSEYLYEEGRFFLYTNELNNIDNLDALLLFKEGIWDDKQLFNFVLGEEKENQLFDLINVKEEQLRAKELLKAADALPVPTIENSSKGIAFDVETTGFSKHNDEILQLSILDLDGNVLFNSYVKPYWKTEWTSAMEVNGITPEMVENAPYPHEILPQIKGIVNSANVLVGYNNPFDMGFLEQWGINFEGKQVYDVMREFAPVYGVWREDKGEYKNQKLGIAAEFFGFEFNAHDSLEDTKATLHCYKQLISPEKSWAEAQLEIIQSTNPAPNETLAWVRNIYDIHDFVGGIKWGMDNNGYEKGTDFTPDYTAEMMQEAMQTGMITVYSSYPIEQGIFVTPSRMEAEGYAGDGVVYEKTVRTSEVAWIDEGQGQYANVLEWVQTKADIAQELKNRGYEVSEETLLKGIGEYNQHDHFNKWEEEGSKEAIATYIENTSFVENPIGDAEWCYNDPEREEILAVYYNPDSVAGGQLVEVHIGYDLILEAQEKATDEDHFFAIISSNSTQYLIDIDTPEFKEAVKEYKERPSEFEYSKDNLIGVAIRYGIGIDEYYRTKYAEVNPQLTKEEADAEFEAQKAENQAMFKYVTTRFLQENGITVSDETYDEAYKHYVTDLGNAELPEKLAQYIENTYFTENPIGEKDWFINFPARQTASAIYFNPNSNRGGQFVISSLPYDFILKAKEETQTTEEFFEYLNDYAHTDLIDIDTSEFKDIIKEYKDREPDFIDQTEETMNGLVQAAEHGKNLELAIAFFHLESNDYAYIQENADELIYCHKNNKSIDEFNEWLSYEYILGEKISFEDYKGFDAHWDVDIFEYVADPTPQAIADAKAWFERYKNEKTQGKENRMISDEVILKIANGIGNTIKSVDDYNIRDYALNGGATDEEVAEITNAIRSASLGEDNFSVSETTLLKLANGIGNSIASVNDLDIVRFAEIGGASNEEISLIQKAIEIAIDGEIENSDTHREDNGVYKNNITTVKTNIGEIPIEDYREIVAGQYGYNSYEEMYNAGLRLGDEYDKKPERSDNMAKVQEKESQAGVALPEEKKDAKELLTEQLQEGIKNVLNSEKFKSWLDTSNKLFLNNYSFNNAILVWLQNPDATYTMGYEQWKDYGRSVAKGAKGIKIFVPVIAYEKTEGALWNMIKNSLQKQLSNNPSLQQATYRIGMSKLEVTANRNGVYGLVIDGKERGLKTEKEMKDFIKHSVLNKVPMYFTVGTVFNHADTIIPEYLWVKKGFTKDELVRDENGKAIKNKRGEYKIINTPERQAKFNPSLDLSVPQIDEQKAAVLYDALKAVSERNGIHVYEKNREEDETLKGGADGYFSRDFSSENPKGYIVIPTDLDPTRKISVMLHEMGHSDMHGDLKKLAEKMGENYIPSQMREIQAESVAYLVGKNFGLSTETSSFQYLAAYTQGFELQALSKSIEIIYNECKQLTNELKTELEVRGLNMDLSERDTTPIDKDAIKTLTKAYMSYAVEQDNRVADIEKELPDLAKQNAGKKNVLSVVVAQNLNVQRQSEDIVLIKDAVAELKTAETLESQQDCISRIEAAKERLESYKKDFANLTVQFQEATRDNENLKSRFVDKPEATIEAMKQDYPLLQELNSAQVQYLAKSEYVKTEISPLLRNDPQKFVDKACERALQMDKVASKNGMFVEVSFCEQWTDKPIVSDGALMHPKVADTIIKQAESQIRGLKAQAQSVGDYFPYNKCDLMVFKAEDGQIATAFKTRVDIGDGSQMGLADHLKQVSNVKFAAEFEKAASEKGAKDKILFNEAAKVNVQEKPAREARPSDKGMSDKEWAQQINEAKEAMKEEKESQREEKARSKKNKNDMEH